MEAISNHPAEVSIKQRLLARFGKAKEIVGTNWRKRLSKTDAFFNTLDGEAYMRSVAQEYSDPKRGHVDRIEKVTLALERIAGIAEKPI